MKITVPLQEIGIKLESELLWAFDLGDNTYQIDSCPFFAYNISLGDKLLANRSDVNRPPIFERITDKSGNRTLRILFDVGLIESSNTTEILEWIKNNGCGYEGYNDRYFSINVPALINYDKICVYLASKGIEWEDADKY